MLNETRYPETVKETSVLLARLFKEKEKVITAYGDADGDERAISVSLKQLNTIFPVNFSNSSLTFLCGALLKSISGIITEAALYSTKPFDLFPPALQAGFLFTHTSLFPSTALYGMKVILPDGRLMTLGSSAFASVTGYNAMELFLGTKNILGTPVEYTIRLNPRSHEKDKEYDADLKKYEKKQEEEERKLLLAMKNVYDPTHLLNTTML